MNPEGYILALGSSGEESNDTAGQTDAQDVVDVGGGALHHQEDVDNILQFSIIKTYTQNVE